MSARRQVQLLALVVVLTGLLDFANATTEVVQTRLLAPSQLLTPGVQNLASGLAALLGLALVLLGRGLAGRRRLAQQAAVGVLALSTVLHLLRGANLPAAAVTAALALLLVARRNLFVVALPARRLRTVALTLPVVVAAELGYGAAGLALRHAAVHPSPRPGTVVVEVLGRLVGVSGPLRVSGPYGHWFPQSLTVAGLVTAAWAIGLLLAPVRDTAPGGRADPAALRPLLGRPDGDTLDPFVLRGDKSHVFSPDRLAVLGYRYLAGVGLAAGDPVGDPRSYPGAVAAFLDLCDRHGWRPAIIAVRGDRLPIYESLGLRSIYVGDEAVVDVAGFTLGGRSRRNVRQAVARTRNSGVTVELCREGALDDGLRRELLRIDALDRGRAPDRGFAMALDALLSGRDADCLVVLCREPGGAPVAFQRYVPCRAGRGLSLDAMRRLPDAPNGVNERMIVELLDWCRTEGVAEVSLNFSAFRRLLDPAVRHGRGQEAEAWLLRRFDPVVQLHSLYRFNAKFGPRWVPRHVVYRSRADLGAIGLAALAAEAYLPGARRAGPGGSQREQVREPVPLAGGAPE